MLGNVRQTRLCPELLGTRLSARSFILLFVQPTCDHAVCVIYPFLRSASDCISLSGKNSFNSCIVFGCDLITLLEHLPFLIFRIY